MEMEGYKMRATFNVTKQLLAGGCFGTFIRFELSHYLKTGDVTYDLD